jgi:hypothetical protein
MTRGALLVNGVRYLETDEETNTIGIFFGFDEAEANGITIREYGFSGGGVQYVASVTGDLALGDVFHQDTNPTGDVTPTVQEKSNLYLRDLLGTLPGSRITVSAITEDQLSFAAAEGFNSLIQNLAERTLDQAGS